MKKVVKEFWGRVGSRLAAKASLVQREVANEMRRRDYRQKLWHYFLLAFGGAGPFARRQQLTNYLRESSAVRAPGDDYRRAGQMDFRDYDENDEEF